MKCLAISTGCALCIGPCLSAILSSIGILSGSEVSDCNVFRHFGQLVIYFFMGSGVEKVVSSYGGSYGAL